MKIVIAPDSFKGSCTSIEAAIYIKKGVMKVFPDADITTISVADGGEGTVETILQSIQGEMIYEDVTGPLGDTITASYAILKNSTAVIEMASASGIVLVPEDKKDVLNATTRGTGELIKSAMDRGCKKIIIGIGGSATNDGGVGMAQALGYSFIDKDGNELNPGGGNLADLDKITTNKIDKRLQQTQIIVACDVTNPLYGLNGAAYIYSPQKGATLEMVKLLDKGLRHLNEIAVKQLGLNMADIPGAGAAGGLGFGLLTFCKARLESGIDIVLDIIDFKGHLTDCDLIITGEGNIDGQSINGKVPVGIAKIAKENNIPLIVLAGGIGNSIDELYNLGIDSIMPSVNSVMDLPEAINRTEELLIQAAERSMKMIKVGMEISKSDI